MPGTRIFTLSGLLLWGAGMGFAQADYFPLEQGNQWVYRSSGRFAGQMWTVTVARTEKVGDRAYSVVTGFPEGELWLRKEAGGKMYVWRPEVKREDVFLDFGAPLNTLSPSAIDSCTGEARISERSAAYKGPAAASEKALEVSYERARCADAGVIQDVFVPDVGLVRRTSSSFGGPVVFELSSLRKGTANAVSLELTLDKTVYVAEPAPPGYPVMTARLRLRNSGEKSVRMQFPRGQTYEFVIRDEKGRVAYQWSAEQMFTQMMHDEVFGPGERIWTLTIPLFVKGKVLGQGRYTAEGWLTTVEGKIPAGSVSFEMKHAY